MNKDFFIISLHTYLLPTYSLINLAVSVVKDELQQISNALGECHL